MHYDYFLCAFGLGILGVVLVLRRYHNSASGGYGYGKNASLSNLTKKETIFLVISLAILLVGFLGITK